MSCCPTDDCNNGDSTLTIALNVLDIVGNFAGVAVATAFGLLQLRYWRRRHGTTDHSEEAEIPVESRVLRPQPAIIPQDVKFLDSSDHQPSAGVDEEQPSSSPQSVKGPVPWALDTSR